MAPWGSSVNAPFVQITEDTLIDARSSGCSRIALQGMTLDLAGDLTIFAHGLESINGLKVRSTDGQPHTVTVMVPGSTPCGSPNSVSLSPGTVADQLTRIDVRVAGKLTVHGVSDLGGDVSAGCFAASGAVKVGRR